MATDLRVEQFAAFALRVSTIHGIAATADEIGDHGLRAVPADFCAVTLWRRSARLETVGTVDDRVRQADRLQHQLREGPCVRAGRPEPLISSADLAGDDRWPRWGPRAAALGLCSLVSAELTADGRGLGTLTFYRATSDCFTADELTTVSYFAAHAAAAMAGALTEENLRAAMEARTVSGQAIGILMERYALDSDQAIAVLRRYSQDTNIRIRTIAERLIETGELPDLPPSSGSRWQLRCREKPED